MKSVAIKGLIFSACVLAASVAAAQVIFQGDDEYIGGVPTNPADYGMDIVGHPDVFDLTGWRVLRGSDSLTVEIYGAYFAKLMSNEALGTSMGDLFISTSPLTWTTTAETVDDYFGTGTNWDYAVKLGIYQNYGALNAYNAGNPAPAGVHQITNPATQIELSDFWLAASGEPYRAMQEVQAKNLGQALGTASWFISSNDNLLSITIDNYKDIFGTGDLAFHWTMTCANDVIEFAIPEPSTIGILGAFGLIGYLFARRRWQARK